MKTLIKKFSKYLSVVLMFLMISSFLQIESKAWNGLVNLDPYQQVDTEMRAAWVATVYNIDINVQPGKGETAINAWKQYYLDILDNAEKNNLNTIIFQIRPNNDAFYPSKYNPWSEYLSPDGTNPGWDPVEWMIEVTHARGMEYHAWLNPYRTSVGTLSYDLTVSDPVTGIERIQDVDTAALNNYKEEYFARLREQNPGMENPALATGEELYHNVLLGTEDKFILNPASETVIQHLHNTISEIIDNYDIDGIHFDDYFYPNDTAYAGSNTELKGRTYSCEPEVDLADYKQYLAECSDAGVEALSVYDWRRENVNTLIKGLSDLIREKNQTKTTKCAFGISPAARWAPSVEVCSSEPYRGAEGGMSGSCNNYYSYSDLFADTYKWAKEEWVDYITPQNYTNLDGAYAEIAKWWADALEGSNTKLYMGTAIYQVSDSWGESGALEMYYQVRYNQSENPKVDGYFFYNYKSMLSGLRVNAMNTLVKYCWKYDALTPLYDNYTYDKLVTERATVKSISKDENGLVTLTVNPVEGAKGYAVYGFAKDDTTMSFDDKKNMKDLEINPETPLTFTAEDDMFYVLVTYDNDNTIYNNTSLIEIPTINSEPEVSISTDKKNYGLNDTAKITVNVNDDDLDLLLLDLAYSPDGVNFVEIVTGTEVENGQYEFTYKLTELTNNALFKATLSDGKTNVESTITINVVDMTPTISLSNVDDCNVGDPIYVDVEVGNVSGTFKCDVYLMNGDSEYELVESINQSTDFFSIAVTAENAGEQAIRVVITSGSYKNEAISNQFVVNEVSSGGGSSSGSNCNMGTMFFQLFSMITLLTFILRKTRR